MARSRFAAIFDRYSKEFAGSSPLYARARELFPDGITHVSRFMRPFPIYVRRAKGSTKWDVDGHELIDYWMGHGALLLGHLHPRVEEAIKEQASCGTHYGACHELELRWAELIVQLLPSAEMVRFFSSGTEATQMALRLARAFTGRKKLVKFAGHFHGWQDNVTPGVQPPFSAPPPPGILPEVTVNTMVLPASDPTEFERTLASRDDIACVIVEPTGASYGTVPLAPGFLETVRELTRKHGVLLIFDEVVTGFRVSPGGAQQALGITPDLTTLGKVVAGGLPGAAVAGRRDVMEMLCYNTGNNARIRHPGTFNANPLSAAAGVATLELLADGRLIACANARCRRLLDGMTETVKKRAVNWCVYGDYSIFHLLTDCDDADPQAMWKYDPEALKRGGDPETLDALRCAMLLNGVDFFGPKGFVSAVHSEDDIEKTIAAFDAALEMMYGG